MSSSPPTEERFKINFVTLIEICEEMVQDGDEHKVCELTPTMFGILKIIVRNIDSKFLIERFIRKTYDYWGKIYEKDIDYFKNLGVELFNMAEDKGIDNMLDGDDRSIAGGLKFTHVSLFKNLLSASYIDTNGVTVKIFDDDRVADTWKIMHSFVKQSILYIHTNRKMVDGSYTNDYFSNVNVKENAEKWRVKNVLSDGN